MINRYQGNSGKVTRIEEKPHSGTGQGREAPQTQHSPSPGQGRGHYTQQQRTQNPLGDILGKITKLIPGGANPLSKLETEDIILLLILYLMYRESGDRELLMVMGAMLLM